jgi:hypothetical protein
VPAGNGDLSVIDMDVDPEMLPQFFAMAAEMMGRAFGGGRTPKTHLICLRGKLLEVDHATKMAYSQRQCDIIIDRTLLGGGAYVSTVFLDKLFRIQIGDHEIPPFETMAFGLKREYRWNYNTYKEAVEGHKVAVWQVQQIQTAMKQPKIERRIKKWKRRLQQWIRKAKYRGPLWVWNHAPEAMLFIKTYSIYPQLQIEIQWLMVLLVMAKEKLFAASADSESSPEPESHST